MNGQSIDRGAPWNKKKVVLQFPPVRVLLLSFFFIAEFTFSNTFTLFLNNTRLLPLLHTYVSKTDYVSFAGTKYL